VAARIHINANKHREIELWLNEEGRDLVVHELQKLGPEHDHVHLGPSGHEPEVPLQTIPYRPTDQVFRWGKVLFRLDEWDAEHFPHVLEEPAEVESSADARKSSHFQQGMDFFLVQFRSQGSNVASVYNFGWNEGDALRRALEGFNQHTDGDPRANGGDLEVRVGRRVTETVFSQEWRPLSASD
jgi:hypothetical protein